MLELLPSVLKVRSFAVALANELVVRHAAALLIAECDQELAAKSLPYLQRQGRCLMRQ